MPESTHDLCPDFRDAKEVHPELGRFVGVAKSRQRRNDNIKRISRVVAICCRIGKKRHDLEHLPLLIDEVDEAFLCFVTVVMESREKIQLCFPIEGINPVAAQV